MQQQIFILLLLVLIGMLYIFVLTATTTGIWSAPPSQFTVTQDNEETKISFQQGVKVSSLVQDDVYNNLFMYVNQHPDEVSQVETISKDILESSGIKKTDDASADAKITIKVKGHDLAGKNANKQRTPEVQQLQQDAKNLIAKNQIAEAVATYEKWIEIAPKDALPYLRLAEIYKVYFIGCKIINYQ